MAKRYIFVRMPEDIYKRYKDIKCKMEKDISLVVGKPTKLTMPKVFNAVVSPELNQNYIQVDLKKLASMGKVVKK